MAEPPKELKDALSRLLINDQTKQPKTSYAFWSTQPVAQFHEEEDVGPAEDEGGAIDKPKTVSDIRQEPLSLPQNFEWTVCDVNDDSELKEIYELLSAHYVEDDDAMFRFDYSPEFLRWALQPPGYRREWHCGVRVSSNKKLVAFISAVPATLRVRSAELHLVEINFLCVHKKLRQKRLAPVLIKEITRRVNLCDIWQAVYTAGVVLPKPVAECQYWHRTLNPKKLIAVGFSRLGPRMTMARTIKLYKLPEKPTIPGVRQMRQEDVPVVRSLLNDYLARYSLAPKMSEEEVSHWLSYQEDVVYSYVVEDPKTKQVSDFFSFYTLPSTIIGHPDYSTLKAAYMFYVVPNTFSAKELVYESLILAASTGHDVFNALDILENESLLQDLKFGPGDGKLRYYLFNWRTKAVDPNKVGLVML